MKLRDGANVIRGLWLTSPSARPLPPKTSRVKPSECQREPGLRDVEGRYREHGLLIRSLARSDARVIARGGDGGVVATDRVYGHDGRPLG